MEFKKYSSIDNHYNAKFLNKIPDHLKNGPWVILEKYDGANLQITLSPNSPVKIGRRTDWLTEGEKFYNVWNTVSKYQDILDYFQKGVNTHGVSMTLYCELYGKGVQKRIDYGPEQKIVCFDISVEGEYLSWFDFFHFVENHNEHQDTKDFFILPIKNTTTLIEALSYDVESHNKEKLTIEGVVLKPYFSSERLNGGDRIIIKKKSLAFSDKMEGATDQAKIAQFSPEVVEFNTKFRGYLNTNRMLDLFSKHGPIEDIRDMGKYIKLLMDDAKEDFNKQHQIPNYLTTKDLKDIFNVGSAAALLLKNYLQENTTHDTKDSQ